MKLAKTGDILFSVLAAAAILGFVCGAEAATVRMASYISFESPLALGKDSDIGIGWVHALPHDIITLDTAGRVQIAGNGRVRIQQGYPGLVSIDEMGNQGMNFLPMNYQYSGSVGSLTAICSLNKVDEEDCYKFVPFSGVSEKLLYIGMHVTMVDELRLKEKNISSFDMSVVFQ